MKRLVLATAGLFALAGAAHAGDIQYGSTHVTTSVEAICTLTPTDMADISFANIIKPDGSLNDAAVATTVDTTGFCNGMGSTLKVSMDGMIRDTTDGTGAPTGFSNSIYFTPAVTVNGAPVANFTDVSVGAFNGTVHITANTPTSYGKTPVAGSYKGRITVSLSPAI